MSRFQFRLKPVQELRAHIEQEYKDVLARERIRLNELEDEKRQLENKFSFWSAQYLENAEIGMSPSDAVTINNYIEELKRLIVENENHRSAQTIVVEKARVELIDKMKDRKTMDVLYEKQLASFMEEDRHKTELEIEEMITSRLFIN